MHAPQFCVIIKFALHSTKELLSGGMDAPIFIFILFLSPIYVLWRVVLYVGQYVLG